jgi:5'-nucleotidase
MNETARPYLLLTNDDGIEAPGLQNLADILEPYFDLLIVAPHRERSAAGHAISVMRDLKLEQFHREQKHWGWSFQGKPADCVKVAATVISKDRPFDLVLSGINRGQNLGVNILYSGTVAAAREAVVLGIPAIAFSVSFSNILEVRFDTAAKVALDLTRRVIKRKIPPGVMLNVNVPPVNYEDLQGFAITRMGNSGFRDKFHDVAGEFEGTSRLVRNVGDRFYPSTLEHHDLDDKAVKQNKVSITPLHIDATAHQFLNELEDLTLPPRD